MESNLTGYANKMIIVIICVSMLLIIGGIIFLRSPLAVEFALGVAMACGLNIVKVKLLKHAVERATTRGVGAAGYTMGMYLIRFVLTGLVLVASHYIPFVGMPGALIGLISMPIASYSLRFFIKDDGPIPSTNEVIEGDTVDMENHND